MFIVNSVDVNSEKRNYVKTALLLLGLLCFLLLVAVINLTKRSRLLEDEKTNLTIERDQLEAINTNLTKERDELHKQLLEASSCPDFWTRFGGHCYFISNSKKTWHVSKQDCENRGATLAVVSNEEEQRFISSLKQRLWIGLNDLENEGVWKWVNGENVGRTYWKRGQPNNCCRGEDCAELSGQEKDPLINWNDRSCKQKEFFICEKALQ
uniref:C-type lectin domain-containing protein n=1 Tax=Sphaeramia orbicularis TaxID=375764 RepID=A0A673CCX5_9TELE